MTSLLLLFLGCGEELYATCEVADDCEVPSDEVEATCLPKAGEGFCTWTCGTDADCDDPDRDDREPDDVGLVCASFEDEEGAWCFPPCDGDDGCPPDFTCRSTGGGSENQKVCFPDG